MIINIFGFKNLINLPFCKFDNALCIDNKCHFSHSNKCYLNHHNIQKYITAPIMRGMDSYGRNYLLFVYTNIETNLNFFQKLRSELRAFK